ncbi:hypothetical protein K1T71_010883 [Dendrolimus kikuchii]|uniref:Uncharacterized protein n=1 Tax=Dendrolimus kikuchii TaxID=765133 RepID=A0ACC1CQ37_9NEOP|nr:hypothetical protein K1T71_010883 [Dendrolimus kikuchii]
MANTLDSSSQLGYEKSEETFSDWDKHSKNTDKSLEFMIVTQGDNVHWSTAANSKIEASGDSEKRRYIMAMRHGERVDLTFGQWVPHCFDENGKYVRKDLNLPIQLPERVGGKDTYARDSPLTRVGRLQAYLVGEGLRLAGVQLKHVYASCAYRSVETAQALLEGLQADPSVKIRVEPGIFEYKMWYMDNGALMTFMTPLELHKAGYNIDLDYTPYVETDITTPETIEEFYKRNEKVMQSVLKDTESEGGNIIFVGHGTTLDQMVTALTRLGDNKTKHPPYEIDTNLLRIPYCAVAAMKDRPFELVDPPCPPSMNSCSGRYNWKMLLDIVS